MPDREIRTYGNQARGLTAASDVNDWMEVKANTGTSTAAGVVTGAWRSRPDVLIANVRRK